MIRYFNFHGLITLSVEGSKEKIDYLCKQCDYFEAYHVEGKVDIRVVCDKFTSILDSNEKCMFINRKYYVTKDKLYAEDRYKTASWKLQLENLDADDTTTLYFDGNSWTKYILHKAFIESLIRYKLNRLGYFMVHSSSVGIEGKGVVFPASPEAGKTSTMLNYLEEGGSFMSDDFSLIGKGKVLAYPTPITLHSHNLKRHPYLMNILSSKEISEIKKRTFVLYATFGMGDISYKVDIWNKLSGDSVAKELPLGNFIMLTKYTGDNIETKEITRFDFIEKLLIVNYFETTIFDSYQRAYHCVNIISAEDEFWNRMRSNAENIILDDTYIELCIPQNYSANTFEAIQTIVKSQMG